ncbi:hypothetical protein DVH24_014574 [Malus domestica]|uniref:RRM domain-containing protein n=1 Tax=Malus domestica TaxID=3750 RepID=A0A498KJU2_MALDO|nr:hypothetical protein DVH24_014574 [Malus domestica]
MSSADLGLESLKLEEMRPIFCGNLDFDARQSDVERLFKRYGKVERVDIKSGFAFVYMDDERDAEYAIRRLDRTEFGRKGRRLRIEWTKHERGIRRPDSRRPSANMKPSKTLFVINFDPVHTRTKDLERHFDPYGKITNIRIRRNFAFIQYESQEDATKALEATNTSKFMDRVISVEYAARDDDDDKRNGHSPDRRGRDMSPERRSNDRGRSPSPYRRDRGSPDYGHGARVSSRTESRRSPDYERAASPVNDRSRPSSRPGPRRSPDYERSASPVNDRSHPSSRPELRRSPSDEGAISPVNDEYRRFVKIATFSSRLYEMLLSFKRCGAVLPHRGKDLVPENQPDMQPPCSVVAEGDQLVLVQFRERGFGVNVGRCTSL